MPNAAFWPTATASASSMWIGMNSSFTAANRFQLANPVVRTNEGICWPAATVTDPAGALMGESV